MIPLLAVAILAIAVLSLLLWRKERQLESVIAASELARKEQAESAARDRRELLVHIQAPQAAPYITAERPLHKQYATTDEEAWEAIKEQVNGGA